MKNILLLSEHYAPKISGTVAYVKQLLAVLPDDNLQLYFLCPVQGDVGEMKAFFDAEQKVTFLQLGVNQNEPPQYTAAERNVLCDFVKTELPTLTRKYNIDIVHLLYGFFLAEIVDTTFLRTNKIKSLFTVHNIPPEECSISWSGDLFWRKWKDDVRKLGVGWINRRRLKKQRFDTYIVPSEQVKQQVLSILPSSTVVVTPHGGAELITAPQKRGVVKGEKIKILTVGGVIPHKRQDWIPEIASFLKKEGLDFEWNIVGPKRNQNYAQYVAKQIEKKEVGAVVNLLGAVTPDQLKKIYVESQLYIQLSREEGFCMTVLDAVAYGLPVMATPVGAIPEMLEKVNGVLLDPYIENIKKVVLHYVTIHDNLYVSDAQLAAFKDEYNWTETANKLLKAYRS